jgi:outer membrane translocation and assembly module TamA
MTKLGLYALIVLLLSLSLPGHAQYALHIHFLDKDSLFNPSRLGLNTNFKSRAECTEYVYRIPSILQTKGFSAASVDTVQFDSLQAMAKIYLGEIYKWGTIRTRKEDAIILNAVGWNQRRFISKPVNFQNFQHEQERILDYLENNGYPFGKIFLDSISINNGALVGSLIVDKGPLYKIDSIHLFGTAKISNDFLQRYLGIQDGSIYRKDRLQSISRKISELPYLQEENSWKLTMLGTGSILNLYLKPKKSSQIDVLIGLLPNNDQTANNKLLVTGEATVNLKNQLGVGESIGLNWQQLQPQSPRLNLYYQQPYIFKSPFGLNFSFDLYKKDSSFITINGILGAQYAASSNKVGTVFIQAFSSSQLNVDTAQVIETHQLPSQADISSVSLGVSYEFSNTNYRFNPLRGNELLFTGTVGTKTVKKNATILKLSDPGDPGFDFNSLYDTIQLNSYEFRLKLIGAHFFQTSRASTLKLGVNTGLFQSPNIFRNELFQIGGYKVMRGFDEESILASVYAVGTLEYRYLIAQNSFLFAFTDIGWAKNDVPGFQVNSGYLGAGLGLAFETKAGIFNISYAVGKQNDLPFNFRQAKIHIGYLNFF